ncbi:eukaryotic aspartyl protease [Opisthorchis viverrini]|uniref:Eukaryotic aspartyl protease n=1 Tax=Opisthorchis viverrini TaxID=6198 RepID=A0A1S8WQZ8_OPIVI|nr:eukaryotic aspartyl protease [Opisthorchis viverrini]
MGFHGFVRFDYTSFRLNGIPPIRMAFFLLSSYKPNQGLPVEGDGHMGLGHTEATRTIVDMSILNVLSEAQLIDHKRFTLLCVCDAHRNDLEPDAQVVFGSHHKIYPEDFQMTPAYVARGGWKVEVRGLRTPTQSISLMAFTATLDSTTWLNGASVERAGLINAALGGTLSENVYTVDCNQISQLPTLVFIFNGFELSLQPEQYVQKEQRHGRTRCFSSIVSNPGIRNKDMVLGMAFMEQFLTMFDQEAKNVGFQPRIC